MNNELTEINPTIIETEVIPRNVSYARSLRMLADFYEKKPEMFLPELVMKIYGTNGAKDLAICAKALGTFKKEYEQDFIYISKSFGDITLKVAEYREKTCERIVTGKRKVVKEIPIETKTVEVEEDIVEWKCKGTSLLEKIAENNLIPEQGEL